jgi:hypothetical protein
MNEEELTLAIYTPPFEAKRIHLSDGAVYDVRRPGSIAIGRRNSGIVVDGQIHMISNLHITRIEPLAAVAS